MYIQDTLTMDILNPKETTKYYMPTWGPYLPRAPRFYPKLPPPVAGPGSKYAFHICHPKPI